MSREIFGSGHWTWGGGWLSQLAIPFHDFAGSSVVNMIGGLAALIGASVLGPRLGRYGKDGKAKAISLIFVTTNIAAAGGSLSTLIFIWLKYLNGLRVERRIEEDGLDVYEHGESAYNL